MEHIQSPRLRKLSWTTALGVVLAAAGVLTPGLSKAQATEPQTRTFSITVDGKKAGEYNMIIEKQPDGTLVLLAKSNVRVTILAVPVYTYSYDGKEVWKDGRLTHFEIMGQGEGHGVSHPRGCGQHRVACRRERQGAHG